MAVSIHLHLCLKRTLSLPGYLVAKRLCFTYRYLSTIRSKMLRWIRKKMKKSKQSKTTKPLPDLTQDDSLHIYEEIRDATDGNDDVFYTYTRTNSLPAKARKGYPLFKPDFQARDALYSIAKVPGIDLPRPPSTSSSRRKLSFDEDSAPGKPWSPASRIIDHYDVLDDDSDDETWYEYDTISRDSRPRQRKPSVTRSETGRELRRVTLARDSSLRSCGSGNSDASSGFFSEDTDTDTMHRTSTRRKHRPQSSNAFSRHPSLKSRFKHEQVNNCATPTPQHPANGHFRQFPAPAMFDPNSTAEYLSPVKFVSSSHLSPMNTPKPEVYSKVKRRSEGHVRDYTPIRNVTKPRYGVADVFKAYEIPEFVGQTTSLPSELPHHRPAQRNVCAQSPFWNRNRNQLLQDVIRGNYDRQMSLFV